MRDHELEREQLASMLLSPEAVDVAELLPEHMDSGRHRDVLTAVLAVHARGEELSTNAVRAELVSRGAMDRVGMDWLLDLMDCLPSATEQAVRDRSERLKAYARARRMHEGIRAVLAAPTDGKGPAEWVDESAAKLALLLDNQDTSDSCKLAGDIAMEVYAALDKPEVRGVPTGFQALDKMLGRIRPGQMVIVAGRPGMGKTAFANHIVLGAAARGPVLFHALEMSRSEIVKRMLCNLGGVDMQSLKNGPTGDEWRRLAAAGEVLNRLPLYVDEEPNVRPDMIRSRARRLVRKHGSLSLIVVDYVQLMRDGARSVEHREQEVSSISRSLKLLSKELDCPVLALCQLNRAVEAREDKRPRLSDLRESGSLEQDADVVMCLYRDEAYNPHSSARGQIEVIVRKQREGPCGSVVLGWSGSRMKFWELDT